MSTIIKNALDLNWAASLLTLVLLLLSCIVPYYSCYGQTGADVDQQKSISGSQEITSKEQLKYSAEQQPAIKENKPESPGDLGDEEDAGATLPTAEKVSAEDKPYEKPITLSQSEQLAQTFERLVEAIQNGRKSDKDADLLYREVSSVLQSMRNELLEMMRSWRHSKFNPGEETIRSSDPKSSQNASTDNPNQTVKAIQQGTQEVVAKAERLYKEILALYDLRIKLFEYITSELNSEITGFEHDGVVEFFGEIQQVGVSLRYQMLMSPKLGQRMISNITQAPLPVVVKLIKLILLIVLFKWWRRWAKVNIPHFYQNLLEAQSSKPLVRYASRFLWYADRLRKPLEWMVLIGLFFQIADPKYIQIVDDILWSQIRWLLLAWFCIAFVSALAKRSTGGFRNRTLSIRLKSLRLMIGWLLLLLFALNLAESLTGQGTIYSWVWSLFLVLALPAVILILSWWRPEVRRLLEKEPTLPPLVQSTLEDKTGLKSYKTALLGIGYLVLNWFRHQILRFITSFENGRVLVASLTHMEATRASEIQQSRNEGNSIPASLLNKLLNSDEHIIDSVANDELALLTGRISQGHRGIAVVIAGRGGGKTKLLERLAMETGSKSVIFDCRLGGYDAFIKAFTRAIGLDVETISPDRISRQLDESGIRFVGIDNVHHISRPVLGGQRDLDRMAKLLNSIRANIFWLFTIERSAWQYISRVRAQTLLLEEALELPLWNESQIKELIEHRIEKAGIHLNFSRLALPRQFDDIRYETLEERNRAGYFRILWNISDGNPVQAVRLWVASLSTNSDGNIVVRLPKAKPTKMLDRLNITGLLVLRAIVQMGMATRMDIIESLNLSEAVVTEYIRFSVSNGWIEEHHGYYDIPWDWYLPIRRVLSRQNLMPRRKLGDTV